MVCRTPSRTGVKMNKEELLELIKLDSERYYNLAKEFYKEWLKDSRCECCEDLDVKAGRHVILCEKYKKALAKYTKDLRKEWDYKINLLCAVNLKAAIDSSKIGGTQ